MNIKCTFIDRIEPIDSLYIGNNEERNKDTYFSVNDGRKINATYVNGAYDKVPNSIFKINNQGIFFNGTLCGEANGYDNRSYGDEYPGGNYKPWDTNGEYANIFPTIETYADENAEQVTTSISNIILGKGNFLQNFSKYKILNIVKDGNYAYFIIDKNNGIEKYGNTGRLQEIISLYNYGFFLFDNNIDHIKKSDFFPILESGLNYQETYNPYIKTYSMFVDSYSSEFIKFLYIFNCNPNNNKNDITEHYSNGYNSDSIIIGNFNYVSGRSNFIKGSWNQPIKDNNFIIGNYNNFLINPEDNYSFLNPTPGYIKGSFNTIEFPKGQDIIEDDPFDPADLFQSPIYINGTHNLLTSSDGIYIDGDYNELENTSNEHIEGDYHLTYDSYGNHIEGDTHISANGILVKIIDIVRDINDNTIIFPNKFKYEITAMGNNLKDLNLTEQELLLSPSLNSKKAYVGYMGVKNRFSFEQNKTEIIQADETEKILTTSTNPFGDEILEENISDILNEGFLVVHENYDTRPSFSHIEGLSNQNFGKNNHIEGRSNIATGECSSTAGFRNNNYSNCGTLIGKYGSNETNSLFAVANGTEEEDKLAFEVKDNNEVYINEGNLSFTQEENQFLNSTGNISLGIGNTFVTSSNQNFYFKVDNISYKQPPGLTTIIISPDDTGLNTSIMSNSDFEIDKKVYIKFNHPSNYGLYPFLIKKVVSIDEKNNQYKLNILSLNEELYPMIANVASKMLLPSDNSSNIQKNNISLARGNNIITGSQSINAGRNNLINGNNNFIMGDFIQADGNYINLTGQYSKAFGSKIFSCGVYNTINGRPQHITPINLSPSFEDSLDTDEFAFISFEAENDAIETVVNDYILIVPIKNNWIDSDACLLRIISKKETLENGNIKITLNTPVPYLVDSQYNQLFDDYRIFKVSFLNQANSSVLGMSNFSAGFRNLVEGSNNTAIGNNIHIEGYNNTSYTNYQHVQGKYNIVDINDKYAHIVGNGSAIDNRSNAHTLDWNGNAWFAGDVSVGAENKALATTDLTNVTNENFAAKATEAGIGGGGGVRTCRFVIGTSTAGWTEKDCDYLCDGTDDQIEIQAAIDALPEEGGKILILEGTYNISNGINVKAKVNIQGNNSILKGIGSNFSLSVYSNYYYMMQINNENIIDSLYFTKDSNCNSNLSLIGFGRNNIIKNCHFIKNNYSIMPHFDVSKIENCFFDSSTNLDIYQYLMNFSYDIINCIFNNPSGLFIDGTIMIKNNSFLNYANKKTIINPKSGKISIINNEFIIESGTDSTLVKNYSLIGSDNNTYSINCLKIIGNNIQVGYAGNGIILNNIKQGIIKDNYFSQAGSSLRLEDKFDIKICHGNSFENYGYKEKLIIENNFLKKDVLNTVTSSTIMIKDNFII